MVQHSETAAQTGTIVGLESPQELQKMSIEQLNELAAVSYTHLTLPTICSV